MLRLGFFEQFKGRDTVLLCGSPEDIAALRGKLTTLDEPTTKDIVAIHEICQVSAKYPAELFAQSTNVTGSGNSFVYDKTVSVRLAALENIVSGHQYFDLLSQRTLLISVGEYDESFWSTYG